MTERINPPSVFRPIGTYDHVIKTSPKTLIFVAGQIPVDQNGTIVGKDPSRQLNLEVQLRQTYANIKACLNAAGAEFKDVVRMNTYVVASAQNEYRNLSIRKIKQEVMGGNYGAGTVVFVAGLMPPEALVEIETIAALED